MKNLKYLLKNILFWLEIILTLILLASIVLGIPLFGDIIVSIIITVFLGFYIYFSYEKNGLYNYILNIFSSNIIQIEHNNKIFNIYLTRYSFRVTCIYYCNEHFYCNGTSGDLSTITIEEIYTNNIEDIINEVKEISTKIDTKKMKLSKRYLKID